MAFWPGNYIVTCVISTSSVAHIDIKTPPFTSGMTNHQTI